jgi:hypothetical protein
MPALFEFVQIFYWLSLATWFGSVLFVAIAAPIIFRTVREGDPLLPTVLSVNMEGQHSTLLAGTIVANLLKALTRVELICAAVILVTTAIQLAKQWQDWSAGIPRVVMFVLAVMLVVYDWRFVWPQIDKHRQQYIEHADEPDIANPARDLFDKYQRESELLLKIVLALLLGMIVFSFNISAARVFVAP